jgi:LPS-assembly protein
VEPVVQVVAAPDWANNDDIPNEDSLDFEFDDSNLLSLNRFPGVDRVDPGSRVDYGLQWALSSPFIGEASAFLGQSYRLDNDNAFAKGSGLEDDLSDVVGRIRLVPQEDIDVSYRFRINKDDLTAERHELDLSIGPPALNLDLSYVFLSDDLTTDEFDTREELAFRLGSQLNENWSMQGAHRRDLQDNNALSTSLGLTYLDECFFITVEGKRTYYEDREIDQEDSVMIKLVFKNLGEVGVQ